MLTSLELLVHDRNVSRIVGGATEKAGWNTSTLMLRDVLGDDKGTRRLGYNWAILSFETLNRGSWFSRFYLLFTKSKKIIRDSAAETSKEISG
jgi:hypothetical protein